MCSLLEIALATEYQYSHIKLFRAQSGEACVYLRQMQLFIMSILSEQEFKYDVCSRCWQIEGPLVDTKSNKQSEIRAYITPMCKDQFYAYLSIPKPSNYHPLQFAKC
jgi:hypothetical protein